jgi:hypothetical protein
MTNTRLAAASEATARKAGHAYGQCVGQREPLGAKI